MKRRQCLIVPAVALSFGSEARADIDWGNLIVQSFEGLGSNLDAVRVKAARYTSVRAWKNVSDVDVSAAGAAACAVPVAAYAALPAEFAYLMRQIYDSAMGIGFIVHGNASREDFANILGLWTNELKLDDELLRATYDIAEKLAKAMGEQVAEEAANALIRKAINEYRAARPQSSSPNTAAGMAAGSVAHKPASKLVSQVLAEKSGTKVAGKLGGKVGAKAGAKIGAKYAVKGFAGWIPGASAIVCAGVNWWIMRTMLNSAEEYFTALHSYQLRRYRPQKP
jgi:hypothetical protein